MLLSLTITSLTLGIFCYKDRVAIDHSHMSLQDAMHPLAFHNKNLNIDGAQRTLRLHILTSTSDGEI